MKEKETEKEKENVRKTKSVNSSYNQLRNLTQYRDLTDAEFQDLFEQKMFGIQKSNLFETRIQKKLDEFAEDYDIADLKINDKLVLRSLAQAIISLEDYENFSYNLRADGITQDNVLMFDKVQKVMTDLRSDISKMQDDLRITRKARKGDNEESVVQYLADLKEKAKKFYAERMFYMFCPSCKMLLSTAWFLYPEEKGNKIQLICNRKLDNKETCGHKLQITSKELLEKRGINIPDEVPEFFT